MLKEDRLNLILEQVHKDQKVLLPELSARLQVSEYTIRRDIKILSERGLLKAVRGGALAHSPVPLHFRDRQHHDVGQKKIMAAKAIGFLQEGQVVFFDGGTSALAIAEAIPKDLKITAITNSFPVASVLEDHPRAELIFAGGRLCKTSFTTTGHETLQLFNSVRADICFLGVCSIHPDAGVTVMDYEDALLKRALVNRSEKVIALATLEKLDTAEPYFVCPVKDLHGILTDAADNDLVLKYKAEGVRVI
ncbi:MAG TPA: DeoR/GlpR family DNA-binding transcription regulator [Puia sp.]|jgi:DeoR/GlpR family transcriptional regulator of sugar metabolism|nr:DeoR/GlpR family DNA-binding transcription regulator [Puia sp.]